MLFFSLVHAMWINLFNLVNYEPRLTDGPFMCGTRGLQVEYFVLDCTSGSGIAILFKEGLFSFPVWPIPLSRTKYRLIHDIIQYYHVPKWYGSDLECSYNHESDIAGCETSYMFATHYGSITCILYIKMQIFWCDDSIVLGKLKHFIFQYQMPY